MCVDCQQTIEFIALALVALAQLVEHYVAFELLDFVVTAVVVEEEQLMPSSESLPLEVDFADLLLRSASLQGN